MRSQRIARAIREATDLSRREMLKTMGMGAVAPGMLMKLPGGNLLQGFGSYLPQVAELLLREKVNPEWHKWGPDSGLKSGLEYVLSEPDQGWWTDIRQSVGSPEEALKSVLEEGENFAGGDSDALWLTLIEKHGTENAKKMFQALDQLPMEKLQEIVFSSPGVLREMAKSGWWLPELDDLEEVGAVVLQKADEVRKNAIRTLRYVYPDQYKEFSDYELERSRIQKEYRDQQRAMERGDDDWDDDDDDDWDDDDDDDDDWDMEDDELEEARSQQSPQYSETFGPFDWEHGQTSTWASRRATLGPTPEGASSFAVPQAKLREMALHSDTFPIGHPAAGRVSDFSWSLEEKFRVSKIENPEDAMGGGIPVIVEGDGDDSHWLWYGELVPGEEFTAAITGLRFSLGR